RFPICPTSATPTSARTRTSARGRSQRTIPTSQAGPRVVRRSAATSGPASTMGSRHRSRSGTTPGLRVGRTSQMMSLANLWQASRLGRSRKRDISVESATTTELTRLPGLEVAETKAQVRPEHWIERGPSKRLMLFSGRSHPELAQKIADKLGIQMGDVTLRTFADGNTYCRYEESIRGADLFIVQTSSPPVDKHLVELLIMIDAAKLASAKRITAVLPLYPYSRQDKKSRPPEGITAKLIAEHLQTAGADPVLTMDLHAGQIQGFFVIPVDHMTALPMLAQYFR